MIPINSVVRRKKNHEQRYQVLWLVDSDTRVRLCPADLDAVDAGARRTTVSVATFWNVFEVEP